MRERAKARLVQRLSFQESQTHSFNVALENTGEWKKASQVFRLLKSREPAFRSSEMLRDVYPAPGKEAGSVLSESLSKLEKRLQL